LTLLELWFYGTSMTLAKYLRKKRAKKGQTQKQAAAEVGVSHQAWMAWERGTIPLATRLPQIADWAGVSLNGLRFYLEKSLDD